MSRPKGWRAMKIYTDREQCKDFRVSYSARGAHLVVSANVLLSTKDYDKEHRDYLEPLGSASVVLVRLADDDPGWWTVLEHVEVDAPDKTLDHYEECIRTARPFVFRQALHGKHEQDRADAVEWIEKYGTNIGFSS